jgi:LPS-assembly protein
MIRLRHLRMFLGAAFCCALLSAAWVSAAADAADAAGTASATGAAAAAAGFGAIAPWDGPCLSFRSTQAPPLLAAAGLAPPMLLAAALPAPGTTRRAPPANPLQQLRHPRGFQANGPITYSSEQVTAERDGRITLSGDADVHMNDRRIQADRMVYDRNTSEISVSGKVRYSDPTVQVQGDTGHYGNEGAQFTHAQFQFLTHPGRGTADELSMTPDNIVTLRGVTYTSCPRQRTDWDIRARELRLNTNISRGVARGARVDFEGVPVMYLPYLSFPLSDARQSGLLFPNVGSSSRDGLILGVPWYWNIAPNQDATFTPTYYSDRGLDAGVEYRFLSAHDSGTFDGNLMPHDSRYGAERNFARLLNRLELGNNTRLQADLESVSDTEYFEDFAQGSQSTSTPFLPRELSLVHRDDVWTLGLEASSFQTLDNTLAIDDRPYQALPRLTAAADWSPAGAPLLRLGFGSELVNYQRSACAGWCLDALGEDLADFPRGVDVDGWRLNAQPHLGLDISAPGYFLRPDVAWDFTQYALRGAGPDDPDPTRSLPVVSIDSGLKFERLQGANDAHTITLEPRAMYVYIPYRDQADLPLFDTATPDPNLIELFRPNRYVGVDRIGDANEVTLGLTSEMFSTATGSRYLSATIGQSLYFTPPRVTLPGETLGKHNSGLIGQIDLAAYRNWNVLLDAASNAAVTRIEQAQAQLQYRASGAQVANIGYQYRDGQFEQLSASAAWPLLAHWDVYARAVYSLLDHASIEDFAGFQYRGACWGLRVVWQRSVSTRTGERDTGVSVQLELTGLSNVGSQVDTFLQQTIRGYSPAADRTVTGRMGAAPTVP